MNLDTSDLLIESRLTGSDLDQILVANDRETNNRIFGIQTDPLPPFSPVGLRHGHPAMISPCEL
jgi:hypothetical protein